MKSGRPPRDSVSKENGTVRHFYVDSSGARLATVVVRNSAKGVHLDDLGWIVNAAEGVITPLSKRERHDLAETIADLRSASSSR